MIVCLGLFGLVLNTTFLITGEIGVRKVLGATTASIVALLSKDFLKLVISALFIAVPIAFWVSGSWLKGFAYQIDVPQRLFLAVGIGAVGIVFLTVSFRSVKAILANPIESLRSE